MNKCCLFTVTEKAFKFGRTRIKLRRMPLWYSGWDAGGPLVSWETQRTRNELKILSFCPMLIAGTLADLLQALLWFSLSTALAFFEKGFGILWTMVWRSLSNGWVPILGTMVWYSLNNGLVLFEQGSGILWTMVWHSLNNGLVFLTMFWYSLVFN